MGEWSALELGPGAVNLMGGRAGAARLAHHMKTTDGWLSSKNKVSLNDS